MSEKNFFVYILASQRNGTLYTGMTSDLAGRIYIHREDHRGFHAPLRRPSVGLVPMV